MKILPFALLMSLAIMCSCNNSEVNDNPEADDTPPSTEQTHSEQYPDNTGGSKNLAEKQAAANNQQLRSSEEANNPLVESTTVVEEGPVDDGGVSYSNLAQMVCDCSKKYLGTDPGEEGGTYVSTGSSEYKDAVDCFINKKNKKGIGEISRQKLVRTLKSDCSTIPPKLVMELALRLGNPTE